MTFISTPIKSKSSNRINPISFGRAACAVSDLTYLYVGRGFAYLSVIMDGYSRKIVCWSLHKTLEAQGPLIALEMALVDREESAQELVHHLDRGIQYCSGAYVARLKKVRIAISMTESAGPPSR